MHAVGDVADGHLVPRRGPATAGATSARLTRPCKAETPLVRSRRASAPASSCRRAPHGRPGCTRPRPITSSMDLPMRAASGRERLVHQLGREAVVAGFHRCVRGEDGHPRHLGAGVLPAHAVALHEAPRLLEHDEGAVALVEVQHARLDAQRAAARAGRPRPAAAPGGCACGGRRRRGVLVSWRLKSSLASTLRVEQEQGAAAHRRLPDPGVEMLSRVSTAIVRGSPFLARAGAMARVSRSASP